MVATRIDVTAATALSLQPAFGGTVGFNQPIHSAAGLSISSTGGVVSLQAENRIRGTVSVVDAGLNLARVSALAGATLTANGASLSIGSNTFATAPNRPPFFTNAITTTGSGLFLGDRRSFTLTGPISGGGGVTVAPSSLSIGTWTLSGENTFTGPITVQQAPGSSPGIWNMLAVHSPSGIGTASAINLVGTGAAIGFGSKTPYTIARPMVLSGGGTVHVFDQGGLADVTLTQPISGTGGLTRTGTGILTLNNSNTFSGGTNFAGGYTFAQSDAALGAAGATITLSTGTLMLGTDITTLARPIALMGVEGGSLYNDQAVQFTSAISNATTTPAGFLKAGAGTLVINSQTSNVGSVNINGGTIHLAGTAGRLLATGTMAINQGAALVVDQSATTLNKISGTGSISLRGATLRVIGGPAANTAVTTTGALVLGTASNSGEGASLISLEPDPARHTLLRFGTLSRTANNGAQVVFSGPGLGSSSIASAQPGQTNVQFTTAPTLVNGILPNAIVNRGAGFELASYVAANGVVPASYTASSINTGSIATNNVQVGSDTITAAGTINAAKFTGGTVNLAAGTLTVTSGALLFTGPTTITGGSLTIGVGTNNSSQAPTANIFTHADTNIASRLFIFRNDNGIDSGLVKSGPGVLTISNTASNWSGQTRILEGTFRMGTNNIIPNESTIVLAPGATLDANGFADTWGSISDLTPIDNITGYQAGTVNLGAASITFAADGVSVTSHHNILGTGTLIKNAGGTFTAVGQQAFSGRVIIGGGTLALGTHRLTGTGFGNVASISIGNTGVSTDVALRLESGLISYDRPIVANAQPGRIATLAFADATSGTLASPISLATAEGLTIDASGGPTLSGTITGAGPLTITSTGIGSVDSRRYSIRLTGTNSHTLGTTLAARTTVISVPGALGSSGSINLGSGTGDDNPELATDAPLTFTRPITIPTSTNAAARFAVIGNRAASGTATFSGAIALPGSRNRLALYSNGEPLVVSGAITGAPGTAVQVGYDFAGVDPAVLSNVILAGPNTFDGGVTFALGTLGIASNAVYSGSTITSSPLGKGALTIGSATLLPSHEPTLMAVGQTRFVPNAVVATRDFAVATSSPAVLFVLENSVDLGAGPRRATIESGASLFLRGPLLGGAATSLVKSGAGTLTIDQTGQFAGSIVANQGVTRFSGNYGIAGNMHIGPGAQAVIDPGPTKVLATSNLSIDAANGGALNVETNGVVVDYTGASPLAQLTEYLQSGFAGGNWNGPGIRSNSAGVNGATSVGIIEASDTGVTQLLGTSFSGNAVLMRYTLAGDATLDGAVNLNDFTSLAAGFGLSGRWFTGDFDYSGHVDLDDFTRLTANFGQTLPAARAAVPEPASSATIALAAVGLLRRRRSQTYFQHTSCGADQ